MVDLIENGGVAILPTETVYGLAGRADQSETIDKIYNIKGRDFNKPLALCVNTIAMANHYGFMTGLAEELAKAFWPGPLSLIVKARNIELDPRLYGRNSRGEKTISMRCPQADWTASMKELPLALTSANPSGEPAPINIQQATAYIGAKVDAIYNGSPCEIGVASTILLIEGQNGTILREGSLTAKDLTAYNIYRDKK